MKLSDFLVSSQYPELIKNLSIKPPESDRLVYFAETSLSVLGRFYPKNRLIITSGFRSPELNNLVGGSTDSDHLHGCAIDCICDGIQVFELYSRILELNLDYRQLRVYLKKNYIHWAWNVPGRNYKHERTLIPF